MRHLRNHLGWCVALAGVSLVSSLAARVAARQATSGSTDLDALMKRVLARRDDNWKKLQQYVLDESQRIDVRGPSNLPIWGDRREYRWFIRDGFFVQSPVSANGVTIGDAERQAYEDDYLHRAEVHDAQAKGRGRGASPQNAPAPATSGTTTAGSTTTASSDSVTLAGSETPLPDVDAIITQTRQPGFVNSAYFLRFKFESGTYAFVGREQFNGLDVLRVEYYPTRLFSHEEEKQRQDLKTGKDTRDQDLNAAMEQMMNQVALVTLWIEPKAAQIVKYTFDNLNLDFLPGAWLFRVTSAKASMTMSQPIAGKPDVWLPSAVDMDFGAMAAIGSVSVHYRDEYHDYLEATTSGRIKRGGGPPL